jgi:hypothetical protein
VALLQMLLSLSLMYEDSQAIQKGFAHDAVFDGKDKQNIKILETL